MKHVKWLWRIFVLVCLTAAGAIIYQLPLWLSPMKPAPKGSLLVVEGWLQLPELKRVVALYQTGNYSGVLVTGGAQAPRPLGMYLSGEIRPNFGFMPVRINHEIRFTTRSTLINGIGARLVVSLGNEVLLDTITPDTVTQWRVKLPRRPETDSLVFAFKNDAVAGRQDRNLFIESMSLYAGTDFILPDRYTYTYHHKGVRHIDTRFDDIPRRTANFLAYLGIPEQDISAAYLPANWHNTASAGMAFEYWMKAYSKPPTNVQLVSKSFHTRRSAWIFQKMTPDIAIVYPWALSPPTSNLDAWRSPEIRREVIRQTGKLILAWLETKGPPKNAHPDPNPYTFKKGITKDPGGHPDSVLGFK